MQSFLCLADTDCYSMLVYVYISFLYFSSFGRVLKPTSCFKCSEVCSNIVFVRTAIRFAMVKITQKCVLARQSA